jgi:hypothetical protein
MVCYCSSPYTGDLDDEGWGLLLLLYKSDRLVKMVCGSSCTGDLCEEDWGATAPSPVQEILERKDSVLILLLLYRRYSLGRNGVLLLLFLYWRYTVGEEG